MSNLVVEPAPADMGGLLEGCEVMKQLTPKGGIPGPGTNCFKVSPGEKD